MSRMSDDLDRGDDVPASGIEQRLFTIPEAAKLLSTSEPQVYALVRS
jgi:predicted DNA-binding transcriptional regulator AlpA